MADLFDIINNSNFDFYFLVVDEFLDINIPQLTNFFSLSPKKLSISLDQPNSGRLLSHPATLEFIKNNSTKTGRQPAIVPFKPSAKIDLICRQNNWILVGNPASLNRLLEDKIKFPILSEKYQLPQIPFLILPFSQDSYLKAQSQFGPNLVLQTHFGWAGNSSLKTSSFSEASAKFTVGSPIKYSPFKNGYSLINNCCLTSRGLIQSPPGLQYTGLPILTQNSLATVGRQWPCQAPIEIQNRVNQVTINFSKLLSDLHYFGYFGLDFFVADHQVYLLECNPRLTASFAFYTDIEINAGITPLFLYHLAEFCHLKYDDLELSRFSNPKIIGSEITAKNPQGTTIKKYHTFTAFSQSADPVSIDPKILTRVL
jgi:hypothetical protein